MGFASITAQNFARTPWPEIDNTPPPGVRGNTRLLELPMNQPASRPQPFRMGHSEMHAEDPAPARRLDTVLGIDRRDLLITTSPGERPERSTVAFRILASQQQR